MKKILLICLLILSLPNIVSANSGPPIIDPLDQSVVFDENSGVSLIEEWVTISFKDNAMDKRFGTGHVSVKYMLKNLDNKDKKLDVLFISPEIDSSSITIMKNGEKVEGISTDKELKVPKNWGSNVPKAIIEPISNEELYKTPNNIYNPNRRINGIKFTIDFKPNEVINLDISYQSPSGFYRFQRIASMVYSQIYYLTPAKFWEGESKVNLKVEFPADSKTRLHSNIPLEKINSYTYEGRLDKIPDEEWIFTFVDSSRLIFGTNDRMVHNTLVLIISLLGIVSGVVLKKRASTPWRILLWVLSIAFLFNYFRFSYGMVFLAYLLGPWILLLIIIIYAFVKYRASEKNKSVL